MAANYGTDGIFIYIVAEQDGRATMVKCGGTKSKVEAKGNGSHLGKDDRHLLNGSVWNEHEHDLCLALWDFVCAMQCGVIC